MIPARASRAFCYGKEPPPVSDAIPVRSWISANLTPRPPGNLQQPLVFTPFHQCLGPSPLPTLHRLSFSTPTPHHTTSNSAHLLRSPFEE